MPVRIAIHATSVLAVAVSAVEDGTAPPPFPRSRTNQKGGSKMEHRTFEAEWGARRRATPPVPSSPPPAPTRSDYVALFPLADEHPSLSSQVRAAFSAESREHPASVRESTFEPHENVSTFRRNATRSRPAQSGVCSCSRRLPPTENGDQRPAAFLVQLMLSAEYAPTAGHELTCVLKKLKFEI